VALERNRAADAIRSRQVSSQEVIAAHLRRIEEVNAAINGVTIVIAEQSVEAAKSADRASLDGADLPRLHGVPFTVKDNIDVVGTQTTQGFKALVTRIRRETPPWSNGCGLPARWYSRFHPPSKARGSGQVFQ